MKRKNKFGAVRTEIDGISFASKAEAKYYSKLKLLERAGEISHLELQPKFPIVVDGAQVRFTSASGKKKRPSNRPMSYFADFQYRDKDGNRHVVDVKGADTKASQIKRCLVEHIYSLKIDIFSLC